MADSATDGIPYEERSNAPDQQAVGVRQPQNLGLLGALQGMGNGISNETIMSVLQPPSQLGTYAAAFSGGVSAMRGQPDPVRAIQQDAQRQQMGVMEILRRMQESQDLKLYREEGRKDARDQHKLAMLEKYTGDLINSKDPEANLLGWTTRGTQMAAAGFPISPEVLQSLARKDLPKETMEQAVRLIGTVPYPELMVMYKGLRPEHEQFLLKAKESDDYRKGLGLESRFEESMKADEFAMKRMASTLAGLKAERDERALALSEKKADQQIAHQNVMEGLGIRAAERGDIALRQADQRIAQTDRRLEAQKTEWDRKFESKDEKKQTGLNVMDQWANEVLSIAGKLDAKNFLPKTSAGVLGGIISGDMSAARAVTNRTLNPYDDDLVEFQKILQGGGVGFERSVLNDMGPRALAAFKGILGFFDKPATLSAIKQSVKFMQDEIKTARGGKQPAEQEIVYKSGGKTLVEKWHPGDPLPSDAQIITIDGKPPF